MMDDTLQKLNREGSGWLPWGISDIAPVGPDVMVDVRFIYQDFFVRKLAGMVSWEYACDEEIITHYRISKEQS